MNKASKRPIDNYADPGTPGSAPKIKLKMGGASASTLPAYGDATGVGYDRELDSDPEEPLAFEEQVILRVPPRLAPRMKDIVEKRDLDPSLWFKFLDSRRGVFHLDNKMYATKLVDLPALVESQKLTGSGGQTIKVADISQMLLVEEQVSEEADVTRGKQFNIDDFVYPHGITPPLKHVRKRRFRKRINKRTIEMVENTVEELLKRDSMAQEVKYEYIDPDTVSDEEVPQTRATPSVGAPTPARNDFDDDPMEVIEEEDENDRDLDVTAEDDDGSGYDSDLANEINKGLEALAATEAAEKAAEKAAADAKSKKEKEKEMESDDSDPDGLFGGSDDSDEEIEAAEEAQKAEEKEEDPQVVDTKRRIKLINEEIDDLEKAISAKETEKARATNPIFKKRFDEVVRKLTADRDLKKNQLSTVTSELDRLLQANAKTPQVTFAEPADENPGTTDVTMADA